MGNRNDEPTTSTNLGASTTTLHMDMIRYVVAVVVLTLTRIIKSVVTGQALVTLELRNTLGEKTQTTQGWYTHISQLAQFMPPPETYKS